MLQKGIFNSLYGVIDAATGEYLLPVNIAWIYYACILLVVIASYLLGSINSAILVSRVMYHDDIRKYGSHNAGLTNMLRTYGKKAALFTLIGDVLKMAVALLLCGFVCGFWYMNAFSYNEYCYICGLVCMIGHIKPVFYHFKGGKGVLSTAAMVAILCPLLFLMLIAIFILLVATTKYISLGSIASAAFFPIMAQGYMQTVLPSGEYNPMIVLVCIILAVIIIVSHRSNIKRLLQREENKFSFHKKS